MQSIGAGVTAAGQGLGGIVWNILGQTYTPMQHDEHCMAWHAVFPPGTFVPPHTHPTQDEFIYVLDGHLDLLLDGRPATADAGDLIRLVRGVPHGIFNRSGAEVRCLFWVTPTAKLWSLFEKIHNLPDPAEVVRLAAQHEVFFEPPPS
jgi:quercetin dioxygenase-like cupin family protein